MAGKGQNKKNERNLALYNDFKTGNFMIIDLIEKYRITSARIYAIVKQMKHYEAQGITVNPAGKLSVGEVWSELDGKRID